MRAEQPDQHRGAGDLSERLQQRLAARGLGWISSPGSLPMVLTNMRTISRDPGKLGRGVSS